jgi:hypothetical protein
MFVMGNNDYFIKTNDPTLWAEAKADGRLKFEFFEQPGSSVTEVMLHDPSRGMSIKITANKIYWSQQPGKWNLLQSGVWRTGTFLSTPCEHAPHGIHWPRV